TGIQVTQHLESQRRQFELVDLAQSYGFHQIDVIDDDLGRSACGAVARPGFDKLVALICAGGVGAVFCLEASRLARNGRDWHHLLELCGLVGARVVDTDGIYDPCQPNDRLLLGMKGTISEFQLNVMRAQMTDALWSKAERGELRILVPIGFTWDRECSVTFDPDLRIQEVIRTIFDKFQELGSARQCMLWMTERDLHFPRPLNGKRSTSFDWRTVTYRNVICVLKNPFYAGAYVYGRTEKRTEIIEGRARRSYGHLLPMDQWRVFIRDHHEGYISWEQFERNQQQLAQNSYSRRDGGTKSGRGGRALLSGMLRCRRCGHILTVAYTGRYHTPTYRCEQLRNAYGDSWCIKFGAWTVESVVVGELLRAVQPMAIEAAMEAERQLKEKRDDARKLHEMELEQARYEAQLAERRYAACDPENRLIASQLEARWEECLRRVEKIGNHLKEIPTSAPTEIIEENFEGLATDLEAAWNAPGTTMRTRQRIVHALVDEIIVDVDEKLSEVILLIRWKGGQHSEVKVKRNTTGGHRNITSAEAEKVIRSMAGRWSDEHIAATLNRMGLRTGTNRTWSKTSVQEFRTSHKIRAHKSVQKNNEWLTMSEVSKRLGVSNHVIRCLIKTGILPAEQVVPGAPYQIRTLDVDCEKVTKAVASRRHKGPCHENTDSQTLRIPGV
ncbi:MAG: recombinase family protein, partial [Anaerolineales bacterium]